MWKFLCERNARVTIWVEFIESSKITALIRTFLGRKKCIKVLITLSEVKIILYYIILFSNRSMIDDIRRSFAFIWQLYYAKNSFMV